MPIFKAGQIWTYHTRPGEEASRLTVLQTDWDWQLGLIVHVWIESLALKNPRMRSGIVDTVGHMPFTEEALQPCVKEIVTEDAPLPEFQEAYAAWRQAFDKGEAGVWTIGVAECLENLERAMNSA